MDQEQSRDRQGAVARESKNRFLAGAALLEPVLTESIVCERWDGRYDAGGELKASQGGSAKALPTRTRHPYRGSTEHI